MENNNNQRKSYATIQVTAAIARALFIIVMGAIMFLAVPLKIAQIAVLDEFFRYFFGGICLLYGGFRLYRGIKGEAN